MKARMNIRSIFIVIAIVFLASMFLVNIVFAKTTGKVSVESAMLREKPNTDSSIVELLSEGAEVEIIDSKDEWYKVKYKDLTGYIREDLVKTSAKRNEKTNPMASNRVETENTVAENSAKTNTVENTAISSGNDTDIKIGKNKISTKTNLKIIPLINAINLEVIEEKTEVEVTEIINDWVKVTVNGNQGWIRKDTISATSKIETKKEENKEEKTETEATEKEETKNETKTMYVSGQTVNLREKADADSKIITQLDINTKVTVLSRKDRWCYIDAGETKGYISAAWLSDTKQETSRSSTNKREDSKKENKKESEKDNKKKEKDIDTSSSKSGSSVVSYAKKYLGSKYVWGGTTPRGFDCSGFTQYVYKNFGISINRTAAAQYSNGKSVSKSNLKAGDLVMFGKSGINHVGIYIGGSRFIHAANPSRGVTTDTLASGYYNTNYVGARRVIK